jgi:chromatin remodeling complex protein RSC6
LEIRKTPQTYLKNECYIKYNRQRLIKLSFQNSQTFDIKMARTNNKSAAPAAPVAPVPETVVSTETVVSEVKAKKARASKKTEAVAPVVDAPVVDAAAPKKARASKKAAVVAASTDAAPEVAATTETDAPASSESGNQLQNMVSEQGQLIQKLLNEIVSLKNNHKLIEKQQARELKSAQKAQLKKKVSKREKSDKPSSFELPTEISGEIARFVGVTEGTKLSRTEVNRKIHEYVKSNALNDTSDKRTINPDDKLRVLLRVPTGAKLGYFNLQTYLSGHFATRQRAPLYK